MAMGYVNTRWEMPPARANEYEKGDLHGWGSYGVMALVQNPFSDTLGAASRLTGIPERELKTDRAANIVGGAALLAEAAGERGSREVSAYLSAVAGGGRAAGKDYKAVAGVGGGKLYADQVSQAVRGGVAKKLRAGDASVLRKPGLEEDTAGSREAEFQAVRRKPPVRWYPAHSSNYTPARRGAAQIDRIVIHVTQGSWSSAIRWFRTSYSDVSAHYVIRSRDGAIAQCVSDLNIAWHAGNWFVNRTSIGIEHEGFFNDPKWFTPEMYRSSARLTAYLCRIYNIPVSRRYIIGHNEASSTACPGNYWWWSYYMRLVRRLARR
jgi:hypothetical protein